VAVRSGHLVTWETFTRDVGALAGALEDRGVGRWLVFAEDAYAFAVGLTAVWQSGSTAVVPPNTQPGTLAHLAEGARGVLTDQSVALGEGLPALRPGALPPRDGWSWRPLDDHAPRLELFTSGTTGERKSIGKALSHLDEEIAGLDRLWASCLEGRQVFATVSHHHIYGLLFRLLWPLCAGRPFRADSPRHADELVPRILESSAAPLDTTPDHLRHQIAYNDYHAQGPS
jgi:acyl-coenzyme A synthetase/AMP-(fatty) acid ligase